MWRDTHGAAIRIRPGSRTGSFAHDELEGFGHARRGHGQVPAAGAGELPVGDHVGVRGALHLQCDGGAVGGPQRDLGRGIAGVLELHIHPVAAVDGDLQRDGRVDGAGALVQHLVGADDGQRIADEILHAGHGPDEPHDHEQDQDGDGTGGHGQALRVGLGRVVACGGEGGNGGGCSKEIRISTNTNKKVEHSECLA